MLNRIFTALYNFGENLISALLGWLGSFFSMLFQGLFELLKLIFKPVFILIAIVFYFIFKLAELVYTLLLVLVSIGKIFYALVMGLLNTLTGFVFNPPAQPNHGSWTPIFKNVFDGLEFYQMDKIAYVLMFLVWITTAYAAIKILSSKGGAAE